MAFLGSQPSFSLCLPCSTCCLSAALSDLERPLALGPRPLTPSSLYRPGYFIEKSIEQAQEFLTRKMALIENQAQNVQGAAQFKQQNLQGTVDVMNQKIMQMRSGAGSSSAGGGTAV